MKAPKHYQPDIIKRFMSDSEFEKFQHSYVNAKFSTGATKFQPDKKVLKLFEQYKTKKINAGDFKKELGLKDNSKFCLLLGRLYQFDMSGNF